MRCFNHTNHIMKKLLVLALVALTGTGFAVEKKRVIVCTVTTGFRHSSIPFAEKTLEKLAKESGVFEIVDFARQPVANVPKKPGKPQDLKPDADDAAKAKYAEDLKKYEAELAKWTTENGGKTNDTEAQMKESMNKLSPQYLISHKIDAVIFANTTGDLPLPDRDGFIKWIEDGHGFCGMHSAGDTFHGFPGYLNMLQAEFKGHGRQVPADLVAGDKTHPANAAIGEAWPIALEEMYEFKDGSHDRAKIHALWFLRHHPQNPSQAGYFPVSWCRMEGKGRVFYTSLGHREDLWDDTDAVKDRKNSPEISKQYQAHILGGIKWALGLAPGSAEPNPETK